MIYSHNSIHDTKVESIAETPIETTIRRSHTVKEPDINIELYSTGFFDGLNGLDAQLPYFIDYWDGYQIGYREYYCGNRASRFACRRQSS